MSEEKVLYFNGEITTPFGDKIYFKSETIAGLKKEMNKSIKKYIDDLFKNNKLGKK